MAKFTVGNRVHCVGYGPAEHSGTVTKVITHECNCDSCCESKVRYLVEWDSSVDSHNSYIEEHQLALIETVCAAYILVDDARKYCRVHNTLGHKFHRTMVGTLVVRWETP
jgi:hypothetical protein